MVKADKLYETLVYSLLPIQSIEISFDEPAVIWRSSEPIVPKKEVGQTSWMRGMLFPARRVSLIPPQEGSEITQVYLSQGENFVNKETWTDPFVSYRTLDTGRIPLRPKGEKPIWRSLFDIIDVTGNHASQLLTQYIRLADTDYACITLYGVETSQASYLDVMRHDLRFRMDITQQEDAVDLLKQSVGAAERLARKLHRCLRDDNIVPESVANDAVNRFYGHCEKQFWQLCEDCIQADSVKTLYLSWCQAIGQYALDAYSSAMQNVNLRGQAMAKAAQQQRWLSAEIRKAKEEAEI